MEPTISPGQLETHSLTIQVLRLDDKPITGEPMATTTSHHGALSHTQVLPDLEEQRAGGDTYFVATGPRAFEGGAIIAAMQTKPGVVVAMLKHGNVCRRVYTPEAYLPIGTEIVIPPEDTSP